MLYTQCNHAAYWIFLPHLNLRFYQIHGFLQVDTSVPLHHSTPDDALIAAGKEDNASYAGSAHSAAEEAKVAAATANQSGSASNQQVAFHI